MLATVKSTTTVAVCLTIAAIVVIGLAHYSNSLPYHRVYTPVERVDEETDGLRVYHDKLRGTTCYETQTGFPALSCVPDSWLNREAGR